MIVPQNDVGAEKSLLGSILLSKNVIHKVSGIVRVQDFYDERHWQIYSCFLELAQKWSPIDLVTTVAQLKANKTLELVGGGSYLGKIMNETPTASNAEAYAKIIADKALMRSLADAWHKIQDLWNDVALDPLDAVNTASDIMQWVTTSNKQWDMVTLWELSEWLFDHFSLIQETGEIDEWLSTWYVSLDKTIGGLKAWSLVIIAARPSMGKTAFMLNLVTTVGKNYSCAVFSLEMSRDELVNRMFYSMMGVNKEIFKPWASEKEIVIVQQFVDKASAMKISIDDTASISVQQIEAKCREMQREKWLDVVFIDYLQLIKGNGKENRVQEVSDMTRQLKGLAKRLKVPVVCLSQLSRWVEARTDKKPNLSDLRESGSIEQDADIVMMLYRPAYYSPDNDEWSFDHTLEVLVKKNRNGPVGTVILDFDMKKQKIVEKL